MIASQDKKQKQLNDLVYKISDHLLDDEEIKEFAVQFQSIYVDGFRHFYSNFFPLIKRIADEKEGSAKLESLNENLQNLQEKIGNLFEEDASYANTSTSIDKLYDHINLELSRWQVYYKDQSQLNQLSISVTKAQSELKELQKSLDGARKSLNKASKKAETLQTEIITVLSIFSAVVIATFGSFSYVSSALASIQQTHVYKTALIVLVSGLIIFNVIGLLMYLVGKITGRSIYANCETPDCSCLNKKGKIKCSGLTRIRKRLPYIFWFNILFITLIFIDVVVWKYSSHFLYLWNFL